METHVETKKEPGRPKTLPERKPEKRSRKALEDEEDQEIPVVQEWKTDKVRDSRRTGARRTKAPGAGTKGTKSARKRKAEEIPSDIADILEESKRP